MRISKAAIQKAQLLLLETDSFSPNALLEEADPWPEMVCFRAQALAIVRHFFELSCQMGRLPSILGREFFRARVSHHAIPSFEDQVVFLRDVELCLAKLNPEHAELMTLAGLYNFSHDEVAEMVHCSRALVHRYFTEALDSFAEILLRANLLSDDYSDRRQRQVTGSSLPERVTAPGKKPPQSVRTLVSDDRCSLSRAGSVASASDSLLVRKG